MPRDLTPLLETISKGSEAPWLLAGPCAIEGPQTLEYAQQTAEALEGLACRWIFKASFDKANRTSLSSPRGVGLGPGLQILAEIRQRLQVPVVTDVHLPEQCAPAAEVADVLQIPAFLARQTDLLKAAGSTGAIVNLKKGQFMAPADMGPASKKLEASGARSVWLTERGTFFGYGRLVVDFTALAEMEALGFPVMLDATHSVQRPGSLGDQTGGDWTLAPLLLRAGAAAGYHGFFVETHPCPLSSPSDGPNMIPLENLREIMQEVLEIAEIRRRRARQLQP
ncbi:MAG: 3-deoxy-8-phosphooctulonate synthase [Planctomycetota bacterium]|nr:MAG: 3-deoxy-8-phosphooctulonate synthase [Planctomycetota bacterium]